MAGCFFQAGLSAVDAIGQICEDTYAEEPIKEDEDENQYSQPEPQTVDLLRVVTLAVFSVGGKALGQRIGILASFVLFNVSFLCIHNLCALMFVL